MPQYTFTTNNAFVDITNDNTPQYNVGWTDAEIRVLPAYPGTTIPILQIIGKHGQELNLRLDEIANVNSTTSFSSANSARQSLEAAFTAARKNGSGGGSGGGIITPPSNPPRTIAYRVGNPPDAPPATYTQKNNGQTLEDLQLYNGTVIEVHVNSDFIPPNNYTYTPMYSATTGAIAFNSSVPINDVYVYVVFQS